ncbi:hypothetical protein Efla_007072 [Eimeria flavescens]
MASAASLPLRRGRLLQLGLLMLLCCSERRAGAAATAAVAAAAAAAAAALLPLPSSGKKVFGIARGGKFAEVGDFCFSLPQGSTGSLVAETMIREQGHELLIHSKSAAAEYRKAAEEAGMSLTAAGDAAATAACKALQTDARVRESLAVRASLISLLFSVFVSFRVFSLNAICGCLCCCLQLIRCQEGQQLDAAYSVTFLNAGGFFSRQFSCQDQGLLQLFLILALFSAGVCCHTLAVYRQQLRQTASPLAAAATCCCCLLGGGIIIYALHLLAYAADGLGLPLLKFVAHVLLLSSRCGALLLFLVLSAKGVEGGAVDAKTNGVISLVALFACGAALAALLGAALSPDELNPAAIYTTCENRFSCLLFSGVYAVLVMITALLNADAATRPQQRRLFFSLCCWGTGYILSPLFVLCLLGGYPLMQAHALLIAEIACLCALQRMACRGGQQRSTQMAEVNSKRHLAANFEEWTCQTPEAQTGEKNQQDERGKE